jgi:hypothetical protein
MPEITSEQGICTADVLRIRSGPAADFAQIGQLARGDRFDVVGKGGAWYRIRRDSIEGFVHGDFVRLGYDDVRVMFDAVQADVRFQILGFFDLLRGDGTGSPMIDCLQRNRYSAFASYYNGAGKAAEYGAKLGAACEAVCRILPLV